jgi:hypothetical protein
MSASDIGPILDDLYASEISASISWIWDGGFNVTLGEPKLVEGWSLLTICDAVLWLRDQACAHTRIATSRENTAALSLRSDFSQRRRDLLPIGSSDWMMGMGQQKDSGTSELHQIA